MQGSPKITVLLSVAIILGLAAAGEGAPKPPALRAPRIALFELAAQNLEKKELEVKNYLEENLSKNLTREGLQVTKVTYAKQSFIRDEAEYARSSQSDFILKGTLTFVDNQFAVSVVLSRRQGKGPLREVLPAWEARVPKELASYVLIPWFKYLSAVIANVAWERPLRQAVFTYCFAWYSEEEKIKKLAEYLAVELPDRLEFGGGLGPKYQVLGFKERTAVIQVCNPSKDVGDYLNLYDYVISGDVQSNLPGKMTIGFKVRTRGKAKLREELTSEKDFPWIVGEVGKIIVARWPKVIAK